jgi:hypothetical protein
MQTYMIKIPNRISDNLPQPYRTALIPHRHVVTTPYPSERSTSIARTLKLLISRPRNSRTMVLDLYSVLPCNPRVQRQLLLDPQCSRIIFVQPQRYRKWSAKQFGFRALSILGSRRVHAICNTTFAILIQQNAKSCKSEP